MAKKGKLIVIEGIDSSGKNTQFELLKKKLKKQVAKFKTIAFPRYEDSVWGEMLSDFLNGKYGKFDEIHPRVALLMYMLDEYTWSRDYGRPWVEKGGWILADRYFTSNVHQIAKYKTIKKKKFRDWLWDAGYNHLKIMKPDLVLFLDVSPENARELLNKRGEVSYLKGKKKDIAEREFEHQQASYREYLYTVENYNFWESVKCTTKGILDTPEVIHERVWKKVEKVL